MPSSQKKKGAAAPSGDVAIREMQGRPNYFWGFVFATFFAVLLVALLDFDPSQVDVSPPKDKNMLGSAGAELAKSLYTAMGVGAWLVPVGLLWLAYLYIFGHSHRINWQKWTGLFLGLFAGTGMFGHFDSHLHHVQTGTLANGMGGVLGSWCANLVESMGSLGGFFFLLLLLGLAAFLAMRDNFLSPQNIRRTMEAWREGRARYAQQVAAMEAKRREQAEMKSRAQNQVLAAQAAAASSTPDDSFAPKSDGLPEPVPFAPIPETPVATPAAPPPGRAPLPSLTRTSPPQRVAPPPSSSPPATPAMRPGQGPSVIPASSRPAAVAAPPPSAPANARPARAALSMRGGAASVSSPDQNLQRDEIAAEFMPEATAASAPASIPAPEPLTEAAPRAPLRMPFKTTTGPAVPAEATPAPAASVPLPLRPSGLTRPSVPLRPSANASPTLKPSESESLASDPLASSGTLTTSGGFTVVPVAEVKKADPNRHRKGNWIYPSVDLLQSNDNPSAGEDLAEQQRTAENLVKILGEFGVKVSMGEIHSGPVITRYDIHPAPGVRVEKILNLEKNIALGLKALSVRVLAPVPGRGCVGIEVPNKKPQSVCIRDLLESEDWVKSKAEIPLALGKDVAGRPLIADLTKMPHLLIAGSTGSGKTVCINTIITSLLFHATPEDLRFVMVDPKIVEMQVYNDLPHMLIPVVTDPKKVPAALKYLLREMERRYKAFAKVSVRNIAGYNAKKIKDAAEARQAAVKEAELEAELSPEERAALREQLEVPRELDGADTPDKFPYIVCIVDELADLMMVAPADIETCIARLAQLARAAGIHLILATQRPSVNVITGVIKANLPSRIAFRVASKVDSRTILDQMGADQLIGKGDMLFLPPGASDLVRSQGAYTADDEINGIVESLKKNGPPQFDENFLASLVEVEGEGEEADDGGPSNPEGWEDDLIPDALEVLKATKRASTSMLQRRLRIGYNRAARIMEILEKRGIVGPENGAQPREILQDLDSVQP